MKAEPLINDRIIFGEEDFAQIVVWKVAKPLVGSAHRYKYRLAYVVRDVCVLRYDNEAGKGDHRHWGDSETPITFVGVDGLLAAFMADIERWNDGHDDGHGDL